MERIRTYEYLLKSRRMILDAVGSLTEAQYAQEFAIGPGTIGKALTHVLIGEWYYVERIRRNHVPPYAQWDIRDENPPPFAVLEKKWAEQSRDTQTMLAEPRDWHESFDYEVTDDHGRDWIVTATASGFFTQLVLHEVHHRAQVMNMLRQLGVECGEVDFNTLMYRRREVGK